MILRGLGVLVTDGLIDRRTFAILELLSGLKNWGEKQAEKYKSCKIRIWKSKFERFSTWISWVKVANFCSRREEGFKVSIFYAINVKVKGLVDDDQVYVMYKLCRFCGWNDWQWIRMWITTTQFLLHHIVYVPELFLI